MKPKECKGCPNLSKVGRIYYCQYTKLSQVQTCFRLMRKRGEL